MRRRRFRSGGSAPPRPPDWRALAVLGAAIGLTAVAIGFLASDLARRLDALETAGADNVEWALSQAEVELLAFHIAVLEARAARPGGLDRLRRRFDIVYSRVGMLDRGPIYGDLARRLDYAEAVARIRAGLDDAVDLIDAPDAALADGLGRLAALAGRLRADVRTLSVRGVERFARAADRQREAVAATLTEAAALTLVLILALIGLVLMLLRQYRLSERRARALAAATQRLETIVETALDAVIVADIDGRVTDFNAAAEAIFGHARAQAVGTRLGDLIVPEDRRAAHEAGLRRHRETGRTRVVGRGRVQMEARRKSGEVFPVELSIERAETAEGPIFVSFLRDISGRRAREAALVAARDRARAGERAKAEFIAVMSHEMRTPLNGVLGGLSLLARGRLDRDQRRQVEIMERSGRLLLSHIESVLDISRFEAGRMLPAPEPVDPGALVAEVVDSQRGVAEAAGLALGWAWVTPRLAPIAADPEFLRRILLNLVGNALKFTETGGVTVELEAVGPAARPASLEIRVIDSGIGIPEDRIETVFEDFETLDRSYGRRAEGAGLGLGIARRLAEAMGGTLGVESEPGAGSVFWLSLPAASAVPVPMRAPVPAAAAAPACLAPLDILVVEDNPTNREVLVAMLRLGGHRVEQAANGAEGVAAAQARRFDLILMDISMPGLDGCAAARAIRGGRGASSAAPVVAVTAHAMAREVAAFRRAGMADHLVKPVTCQALEACLGRVAAQARPLPGPIAQAPATAPAPIDDAHLAELAAQIGAPALARLGRRFLEEGEALMAALGAAAGPQTGADAAAGPGAGLAAGDLTQMAARLHHGAGTAATFGATALRAALLEMEAAAKAGDRAALAALVPRLVPLWRDTRAAFAQRIASPAPP